MSLEPVAAPCLEGPINNSCACLFTETNEKSHVVERDEPQTEHVLDHEQVTQVAPRIRGTRLAVALGIERLDRPFESRAPHIDSARRQPSGAVTTIPRGSHAVEQVDAAGDALQQIRGESDTHKITGHFRGKDGTEILQHAVHDLFRLANREPADGNAGPGAALDGSVCGATAKVLVGSALQDRPEGLRPGREPSALACLALQRSSHRSVRSIPSSARSCGACPGTTWSNAIAMSAPSATWISMARSGVSVRSVPST